jgi:hypothetical protein
MVREYRRIYGCGWSSQRGVMLVLGSRFLEEFTRPGVTVEQGTPQWGGWTFPESAAEPSMNCSTP